MKNKRLLYLPVERYASRWTEYVSGSNGMFAHCVDDDGSVELVTIAPDDELKEIKSGRVLDTFQRASWGFRQTERLLEMIQVHGIDDNTVIYIEDFWHPGMEMIPYACHMAGIHPKVYAFCHAQSVDENDFTYPMRRWMRGFEQGWAQWLTGIFVAAPQLKTMMIGAEKILPDTVKNVAKIHAVGTVMRRQTLIDRYGFSGEQRVDRVLFTSRLDREKKPLMFLELAKYARGEGQKWQFLVLSGRQINNPDMLTAFDCAGIGCMTVSKKDYFHLLSNSKVMFNAASQDFVGYCQLDALAYGCLPLCPRYLTFPDLFGGVSEFMYEEENVRDAYLKLSMMMYGPPEPPTGMDAPGIYTRFGEKYESSVARMLNVMFGPPSLETLIQKGYNK